MTVILSLLCAVTLCCSVAILGGLNAKVKSANAAGASYGAYFNYDSDGGFDTDNIKNGLGTAQTSKVYFGTNSTNPILWRVLSNDYTDDAGGNNGYLLFADTVLGLLTINDSHNLKNVFWYSGKARSFLNGYETYYDNGTKKTLTQSSTFMYSKFNSYERDAMQNNFLKTVAVAPNLVSGTLSPYGTISGVSDAAKGDDGTTAASASNMLNGGYAVMGTTSTAYAIEETTNDKIFFLDYNDIFNTSYGFAAHPLGATYNAETSGFVVETNNAVVGTTSAGNTAQDSGNKRYWLRNPGRDPQSRACYLTVDHSKASYCSYMADVYYRPALNLNPESLIYATTASPAVGTTFSSISAPSGTPEYKLYIKSASDYDAGFDPEIKISGGKLNVKYSGLGVRRMVVLMSPKSAADGGVNYQTAIDTTTATIDLPAGINITDYTVSVMLTSKNGGNNAEEVYGVAAQANSLALPEDIEVTYNGNVWTSNDIFAEIQNKDWYVADAYTAANMTITYPSNAKDVDEYTVACELTTSSGLKWQDSSTNTSAKREFKLKIKQKEVSSLPSFAKDKDTYSANAIDFALNDYDTDELKISGITAGTTALTANTAGTQFKSADNYFTVDYDEVNKKLSATNAAEYTVTFGLADSDNYTWASAISSSPKTKTFTIEKKELVINFLSPLSNKTNFNLKTSTTGNITAEYTTTGGACTPTGGSEEEPMLNLYYVFTNGTTTGGKTQVGSTAKIGDVTLDVTTLKGDGNKFSVGTYTLTFELAPDAAAAVNKNYKLGTTASQAVSVTAGEASIDDIAIVYNTARGENAGDADAAIPSGGLTYEYDKALGVKEFKIYLDFSGISYLDYASPISYADADGAAVTSLNKAGTYTVTAVIKSTDTNYSLPATFATSKFKSYQNNGDGTATITFEVEINKATASVTGSEIPLMFQREGSTVEKYDPAKPPVYNGKPITITLASSALFPDAVKSVVFDDSVIKKTVAGDYEIDATVTLTDNYVTAAGSSTMRVKIPWKIAKEQIDLVWTNIVYADDYFNDSSLAHLQIALLDLTSAQEGKVEYEFYKEATDTVPMTEAEIKALCTNDRFTETTPTYIYVKAVLTEDGAKKYQLEDDAAKNPKRLLLGGNMTQINLSVNDEALKDFEYGDTLDVSKLFTLTNSETGDVWDSDYYDIKVRKDGNVLCALADFKANEADAGEYTFVIEIKPEYADSYVLDKSNKVKFVINPKALELPTIPEIIFSGEYFNLENLLGGSWAQIKDIVKLSGDYKDIRNVSASGYILVLELTDDNYCWAYPEDAESTTKALMRYTATEADVTPVDETTASMKWNVTPMVVDTTNLWSKTAGGATLKLPEAVTKLITGETLSVGYRYYDDAGQYIETPELKGGKSFRVEAVFGGIDAEQGNVLFKTSDGNLAATSDRISYTVPQTGAAAFIGNVKEFVSKTWMGLPVWAWLAIALALIILLIIIIAVCAKRRKSKAEREEIKARKEEERQRREDERRMQQERLQAERELAMAKQQAELEKIRAQAQAGMAGAGMASMAMQQQQPQQQQPAQQAMPAQQPMQAQMPQQMPQAMQMPAQSSGGGNSMTEMMAMMFAQFAGMKADNADKEIAALKSDKEITALRTELEIMKLKLEQVKENNRTVSVGDHELTPEFLGAVIASAVRSNGVLPQSAPVAEIPQNVEESTSVSTPTMYPADAVITTTTTVDTTKKDATAVRREREDSFADVDGFYDNID